MREKRRLRALENRVLREIFGPGGGQGNRGLEENA